ncbi:Annexin [Rhynchospora pubera]|uniref:Annexin n=1 Tax=Rhynchospora pubera TaxID=906938 RepID=A0AAV8CP78_9POAL|nr:Annexin [Rhynchospora pubera]
MADETLSLKKAFSGHGGFGVDETTMAAMVTKWRKQPDQKSRFRSDFSGFFTKIGSIEKCEDDYLLRLKTEFSRFKNIMVLWLMHPWERDARWMHHVMHKSYPFTVIVEIACTRTSEELLGAKRAYQALFNHSVEEDVAYHIKESYSKLLVGLVSSFRYEGPQVDNDMAKWEAKALGNVIKSSGSGKLIQNEEVIRILTTRSKRHLKATFKHYKELHGKPIEEDLGANLCLQETVKCIDKPAKYFSEAINIAFKEGADKPSKLSLTRVIISRADVDMEEIKETYHKQFGVKLEDMITKNTHGHYKDTLLTLIGK